jgi:polyhydroxyalkanoate synthase
MAAVSKRWKNLAGLFTRPKPAVGATPHEIVHAENKWKLLRYRRPGLEPKHASPVLLVPSLINRHYVLDLMPDKSLVEYLVEQGHDVYMIDWGRPGPEDRWITFDDLCDGYIGRAVRKCAERSEAKVHVFGYCLGGTLSVIHAAANPDHMASIVALAAPVRFQDDGQLSAWTREPGFDLDAALDAFGNVPAWLMQASFHMLRPTMNLAKLVYLIDKAGDDDFLEGFRAIEAWANDNVDFPGEVYRRYVQELYREDRLIAGTFTIGGKPARLDAIEAPLLCITFEHDNIVPWRSAAILLDAVSSTDKEHIHLPGGHVGSVVSRAAKKHLWPRISAWMAARDRLETLEQAPPRAPKGIASRRSVTGRSRARS